MRCFVPAWVTVLAMAVCGAMGGLYDEPEAKELVAYLTQENFATAVHPGDRVDGRIWVVELYASWCGHCQQYAKTYTAIGKDILPWKQYVKLGAMDCADTNNTEFCTARNVSSYPTVFEYEWTPPKDAAKAANLAGEDSWTPIADRARDKLRQRLAKQIIEKDKTGAKILQPTQAKDLQGHVVQALSTAKNLVIVVEPEGSSFGGEVALDLHTGAIPDLSAKETEATNPDLVVLQGNITTDESLKEVTASYELKAAYSLIFVNGHKKEHTLLYTGETAPEHPDLPRNAIRDAIMGPPPKAEMPAAAAAPEANSAGDVQLPVAAAPAAAAGDDEKTAAAAAKADEPAAAKDAPKDADAKPNAETAKAAAAEDPAWKKAAELEDAEDAIAKAKAAVDADAAAPAVAAAAAAAAEAASAAAKAKDAKEGAAKPGVAADAGKAAAPPADEQAAAAVAGEEVAAANAAIKAADAKSAQESAAAAAKLVDGGAAGDGNPEDKAAREKALAESKAAVLAKVAAAQKADPEFQKRQAAMLKVRDELRAAEDRDRAERKARKEDPRNKDRDPRDPRGPRDPRDHRDARDPHDDHDPHHEDNEGDRFWKDIETEAKRAAEIKKHIGLLNTCKCNGMTEPHNKRGGPDCASKHKKRAFCYVDKGACYDGRPSDQMGDTAEWSFLACAEEKNKDKIKARMMKHLKSIEESMKRHTKPDHEETQDPTHLRVHTHDLAAAIVMSLRQEVALPKEITGAKLHAVQKYIRALVLYVQVSPALDRALDKLLEAVENQDTIRDWKRMLNDAGVPQIETDPKKTWHQCRGSTVKFTAMRGYTCGLWTLFHSIMAGATAATENTQDILGRRALEAIIGYIIYFFGCKTCVDHFGKELESSAATFPVPTSHELPDEAERPVGMPGDAHWTLWAIHNKVNRRLAHEAAESTDPLHPKVTFPTVEQCGTCRTGQESDLANPKAWDRGQVLGLLSKVYYTTGKFVKAEDATELKDEDDEEREYVDHEPMVDWDRLKAKEDNLKKKHKKMLSTTVEPGSSGFSIHFLIISLVAIMFVLAFCVLSLTYDSEKADRMRKQALRQLRNRHGYGNVLPISSKDM